MAEIEGIVNTLVTPFLESGDVDYETLEKQVNFLIDNGAKTLAYPMHYGESLNLRESEFRNCVQTISRTVAGRIPLFINVSSAGTEITCDNARFAATVGTSGIVVLTPYYWKPSTEQLVEHVAQAANAHGGKVILYNSPGATGTNVGPDTLKRMIDTTPNLIGVKDATFNLVDFTRLCAVANDIPKFGIYTGVEYLAATVPIGGSGSFSAAGEVAPRLTHKLYEASTSGDIERARDLQFRMHRLLEAIQQSYPSGIKHAMAIMGRPVGDVRMPIKSLSTSEVRGIENVMRELNLFEQEPRGW